MSEALATQGTQYASMLTAFESFPQMMQVSEALAHSSIVPQRFQNDPGSVLIALDMAARANLNPLMVMQNLYTVYGTPSFSGKFALTLLRRSGLFSRLGFEYREEGNWEAGVRLVAVSADGENTEYGPWIDKQLTLAMGWMQKKDSMWGRMGDQMARYRATSWFCNTNCPEVLMGLPTKEELEEAPELMRNVTPQEPEQEKVKAKARVVKRLQQELTLPQPQEQQPQEQQPQEQQPQEQQPQQEQEQQQEEEPQDGKPTALDALRDGLKKSGVRGRDFFSWCKDRGMRVPQGDDAQGFAAFAAWFVANARLREEARRELGLEVSF